jgi:hypothetical protein
VHRLPREVLRKTDRHLTSTKVRLRVSTNFSNGPRILQTAFDLSIVDIHDVSGVGSTPVFSWLVNVILTGICYFYFSGNLDI